MGDPSDIHTMDQLVAHLCRADQDRLGLVLTEMQLPSEALLRRAQWNSRRYTRTCLHRTESFELLLICYEEGQATSIHDYYGEKAWIRPLIGRLLEERFEKGSDPGLELVRSSILLPGMTSHVGSENSIHRFSNAERGRTVSLNLYARPLRRWRVYDQGGGSGSLLPVGHR
ncbi:MAG: cysteine dioxygenase family protein [Flavobacteriales bacterium]|nr:cysteine dioxygenase family protein [Flavobacteriales bacterium]